MDAQIAVEGLAETVRSLRTVNAQKVTQRVHKEVAEEVAGRARRKWRAQPSPRTRPSMADRVIRSSGRQTSAAVVLRQSRFPWAAGGEYGSLVHRQFRRWTGNRFTLAPGTTSGYAVNPAIKEALPTIEDMYTDRLIAEWEKEWQTR